jgi:hypothetical protein
MKRIILTILIVIILFGNLMGQLEIMNEGVAGSFDAIDFLNDEIGWIAGEEILLR